MGKLEELSGSDMERTGQFTNILQRDVALPPLDLPDITPVEIALKGELFLGQTSSFAQCTHTYVSGCVNMLENWPFENVGCALESRRCENAALQDE
jgi:hypothetical protein